MRALASPASLKGVLTAWEAAEALAAGFARAGVEAEQAPVADGGEGTAEVLGARVLRLAGVHDAFGREREAPLRALADGTVVVESADAIPLDPARLDVLEASSRGLGELISAVADCERLLVCLGGTATMDGGAGLLNALERAPRPDHGPLRHARDAARGAAGLRAAEGSVSGRRRPAGRASGRPPARRALRRARRSRRRGRPRRRARLSRRRARAGCRVRAPGDRLSRASGGRRPGRHRRGRRRRDDVRGQGARGGRARVP